LSPEQVADILVRVEDKPNEDTVMSTADRLIARGLAEGLTAGKAAGEAEGRAAILLRQLAARFGEPTADVVARVRGAAVADLERWALRVLDARSLGEVFA